MKVSWCWCQSQKATECNLYSRKTSHTAAKILWMSMAKSEFRVYATGFSLIAVSTVQGCFLDLCKLSMSHGSNRGENWLRVLAFISDSSTQYPGQHADFGLNLLFQYPIAYIDFSLYASINENCSESQHKRLSFKLSESQPLSPFIPLHILLAA